MMLRLSVVVLLGLLSSGKAEEEIPQPSQEALSLLASLQQGGEGSRNELRDMANMYELLQLAALQQQHRQRLADLDERDREEGEELPVALPLLAKERLFYPPQDKDEYLKDKRGSYMSLCHFKICNMGRKRSSYWNTWGRN